jgi:hypothetical protein
MKLPITSGEKIVKLLTKAGALNWTSPVREKALKRP